jgi:hypothetical protein
MGEKTPELPPPVAIGVAIGFSTPSGMEKFG